MLFSIILPTYNRASFLPKAINSVLAQTYPNWELIIVDDGSSDNTSQVVGQYHDERIRYLYQNNAERSAARNLGIGNTQGKWITFIDSDNEFLPERLDCLLIFIQSNNLMPCLIHTDILYRHSNNELSYIHKGYNYNPSSTIDELITRIIATPQVCIHRNILDLFKFNPSISIGEDMELWLRIAAQYRILYLEDKLTVIENLHENRSVQKYGKNVLKEYETWTNIFKENKQASGVKSLVKRQKMAEITKKVAIYYALADNRFKAIKFITRSIYVNFSESDLKYKCNILFYILFKIKKLPEIL